MRWGGGAMERFNTQWEGQAGCSSAVSNSRRIRKHRRSGDPEWMECVFVYLCVCDVFLCCCTLVCASFYSITSQIGSICGPCTWSACVRRPVRSQVVWWWTVILTLLNLPIEKKLTWRAGWNVSDIHGIYISHVHLEENTPRKFDMEGKCL